MLSTYDGGATRHYLVRPSTAPRGRTARKRRLFAAVGERLVVVPYWSAVDPAAYANRSSAAVPAYAVDQAGVEACLAEMDGARDGPLNSA